ncbi:hypothetical protein V2J09_019649 [Rumex salicifolius]
MLCAPLRTRLQLWLRDYDKLQSSAVILIYIQIGCALVGSLGALYNGVLLINLAIALFALVAIESGSQRLGRTYAILLIGAIILDITWFILHISSEDYGVLFIFSVKLALSMQIIAFSVRFSSSFLWMRMYRLGASHGQSALSQETDYDMRTSFLNPTTPEINRQISDPENQLGGSIYDPPHYSSLFEVVPENRYSSEDCKYKALEGDNQHSVDNEQHFHEQADPSTIASSSSAAHILCSSFVKKLNALIKSPFIFPNTIFSNLVLLSPPPLLSSSSLPLPEPPIAASSTLSVLISSMAATASQSSDSGGADRALPLWRLRSLFGRGRSGVLDPDDAITAARACSLKRIWMIMRIGRRSFWTA